MRRSAIAAAAIAAWAACGDGGGDAGDGGLDCEEPGTADVTGTVTGGEVAPVSAASYYQLQSEDHLYALELNGPGATCGTAATEGEPRHRLSLLFCDPVETAEYTVVSGGSFPDGPCPSETVALALVEDAFNGDDVDSSMSGYVDLEATDSCLAGNFEIAFTGGDILRGSFSAFACTF